MLYTSQKARRDASIARKQARVNLALTTRRDTRVKADNLYLRNPFCLAIKTLCYERQLCKFRQRIRNSRTTYLFNGEPRRV